MRGLLVHGGVSCVNMMRVGRVLWCVVCGYDAGW